MSSGPIFFDLQDGMGNTLAMGGTVKGEDWSLGSPATANFYIAPSASSALLLSAYAYSQWYPEPSRAYFDGSSMTIYTEAIAIVAAGTGGYYLIKDGLYLQPQASATPAPLALYTNNKFVWQMKQTAGQAFQLKNSNGTYVVFDSNLGFSSVTTPALASIFEFINGFIVVYDSINAENVNAFLVFNTNQTFQCGSRNVSDTRWARLRRRISSGSTP